MKRSNLVKGIICGLMLTTVIGSVAYAKTDSKAFFVGTLNKKYTFKGSNGEYVMDLGDEGLEVKAKSNSYTQKLCTLTARCFNYRTGYVIFEQANSKVLSKNDIMGAGVVRGEYEAPLIDYQGRAITYNSASSVTGILDDFTCTFHQRYR